MKVNSSAKYPSISAGDIYDVSNLRYKKKNTLQMVLHESLYNSRYKKIFPNSILVENGSRVERLIKTRSKEGKTPISNLVIASHHSGRNRNFISSGTTDFSTDSFINSNKDIQPTFERAKNKQGPLRCWFSVKAKARFSGCNTQSSAKIFAKHALRKNAVIQGTNSNIVTGKRDNRSFIRSGDHEEWYFTPSENSMIWVSFNGEA